MREVTSCGVLCFDGDSFLLMRHDKRYDLPKGHMKPGETELQTALRELHEETGIAHDDVEIDPDFRYVVTYFPVYKSLGNELVEKTTIIFVAHLKRSIAVQLSEHVAFEWVAWNPPHIIERETINALLAAIEQHYALRGRPSQWRSNSA
jgi:bis(5'-nucleosidyl)-tetraphosphatase